MDVFKQRIEIEYIKKIKSKQATIGIVGLGYVGLPLAQAFCQGGIKLVGFDIDQKKIDMLIARKSYSYIKHIADKVIHRMRADELFQVTTDFSQDCKCRCRSSSAFRRHCQSMESLILGLF